MPRTRFELLKKTAPFAFADLATKHKDVWYMVTTFVTALRRPLRIAISTVFHHFLSCATAGR